MAKAAALHAGKTAWWEWTVLVPIHVSFPADVIRQQEQQKPDDD